MRLRQGQAFIFHKKSPCHYLRSGSPMKDLLTYTWLLSFTWYPSVPRLFQAECGFHPTLWWCCSEWPEMTCLGAHGTLYHSSQSQGLQETKKSSVTGNSTQVQSQELCLMLWAFLLSIWYLVSPKFKKCNEPSIFGSKSGKTGIHHRLPILTRDNRGF